MWKEEKTEEGEKQKRSYYGWRGFHLGPESAGIGFYITKLMT
jgi:hypothetical protein